jgi:hypothetical protein
MILNLAQISGGQQKRNPYKGFHVFFLFSSYLFHIDETSLMHNLIEEKEQILKEAC